MSVSPSSQRVFFSDYPSQEPLSWFGALKDNGRDASGQHYKRNRFYDPLHGRFTQEDPLGLAGGLNLYGFAGSDPVNFSDPFGLQGCPKVGPPPPACEALKNESAATFFTLYGVLGALKGAAAAGLRAILGAFAEKEASTAVVDAAAIGRGIGQAVKGQLTGKTQSIAASATEAGLGQADAALVAQAAAQEAFGGAFTQQVGENLVVSSVRVGSDIPVFVVDASGKVVKGIADLAVKGTKLILSNVRY